MLYVAGALVVLVALLSAAVVVLLVQRARRARGERILRESEEQLRQLTDGVPVMIWTARQDAKIDYLNRRVTEFTGIPLEQLLDFGWLNSVHPEDVESCTSIFGPAVEARRPFVLEYRIRTADGNWRWLLDTGVPKHASDGTYTGYIGSCIDITERKDAEERIRESRAALQASNREIQHLAGRLIEAQDAERARIARDLHDDVSQQLAGLSIALSGLKHRMSEARVGEDLQVELRALHQRAVLLAQTVRSLSHDLHPTVLRHAGLVDALRSHCSELERAHAIRLTCSAEGDFESIAPEVGLCMYRIAQAALRNVVAHSDAARAAVRLVRAGDLAEITIADEGCGFDTARLLEGGKGLGLVSISERVRLARGVLNIVSERGKGTRVCAQIPASAPAHGGAGSDAESRQRELSFT